MSRTEANKLVEDVSIELREMKTLGMRVPFEPNSLTDVQKAQIIEYREGGMKISEIADLLISQA
ncbi:hypothetical protein F2S72_08960 [Pseudomonas syringae pv. actinidiae]|nr:hypothetical protein [Pseudomonas syringae pv. actinidiae]